MGRKDSFGINALEKLDPQGRVYANNWFSTLVISHYRKTATENGIAQHMSGIVLRWQFYFPWSL